MTLNHLVLGSNPSRATLLPFFYDDEDSLFRWWKDCSPFRRRYSFRREFILFAPDHRALCFLAETINGNGLRWNALVFDLISLVIFIPVFTLIFEYGLRTMLGFDGYPWIFWGFSLLCTALLFLPFVLVLCFNYDPSTFQRPFDLEELFYGSFPLAGAAVSFLALLTPKSKPATSQ